jgi:DNA polymerase (family X)
LNNNEIIRIIKLTGELLDLHGENPFKVRSYLSGAAALESFPGDFKGMSMAELEKIDGVGKAIASKVHSLTEGTLFDEIRDLLEKTPPGVVEMLRIKGIGPKKVGVIWKELGVTTMSELQQACEEDRVSKLKGFGAKTQENIKQNLIFAQSNTGKKLYAQIESFAEDMVNILKQIDSIMEVAVAGDVRRRLEIIETLELVAATEDPVRATTEINNLGFLEQNERESGPYTWRGKHPESNLDVKIYFTKPARFINTLFLKTGTEDHLHLSGENAPPLIKVAKNTSVDSEHQIYEKAKLPYIAPELREGLFELNYIKNYHHDDLIDMKHLKGILHNHSTYSDGVHSLEEMATYCRDLGYEYVGISDHSKTAVYANGLYEGMVLKQHKEIDELNKKLAPFKIFKGIESDILTDGSLDYSDDILSTFDFIVASIHSNLKMDMEKATARLVRAIENPYTTILGHPTGRLLLRREGYPIDHKTIIDACAANNVVIEINANPKRLDMDWRWLNYALEKNVIISINPDAHDINEFKLMYYGVLMGRKGGLTPDRTLNALSAVELEKFFKTRKEQIRR